MSLTDKLKGRVRKFATRVGLVGVLAFSTSCKEMNTILLHYGAYGAHTAGGAAPMTALEYDAALLQGSGITPPSTVGAAPAAGLESLAANAVEYGAVGGTAATEVGISAPVAEGGLMSASNANALAYGAIGPSQGAATVPWYQSPVVSGFMNVISEIGIGDLVGY